MLYEHDAHRLWAACPRTCATPSRPRGSRSSLPGGRPSERAARAQSAASWGCPSFFERQREMRSFGHPDLGRQGNIQSWASDLGRHGDLHHFGQPCIPNSRVPVRMVAASCTGGPDHVTHCHVVFVPFGADFGNSNLPTRTYCVSTT